MYYHDLLFFFVYSKLIDLMLFKYSDNEFLFKFICLFIFLNLSFILLWDRKIEKLEFLLPESSEFMSFLWT